MTKAEIAKERILLMLLPFWTPQIPPVGIACLKSYVEKFGFHVKNYDLNIDFTLREDFDCYIRVLETSLELKPDGAFFNIANDVLRNHLMMEQGDLDQSFYLELLDDIIYKNFYKHLKEDAMLELKQIVGDFYCHLESKFYEILDEEQPTTLGVSVFNGTLPASLFVCKLAKLRNPNIKIVAGGGVFSDDMALNSPNFNYFVENTPYIDKILIGEGERLLLNYLMNRTDPNQKVYSQKDLKNEVILLENLDVPDFRDFDLSHYIHCSTYVSRSCPYQCSFCSETVSWGKYRKKEASQIITEMKKLYARHNNQLFLMADSLLNPVISELSEAMLKEDISFYWDGYLRANPHVCDPENTYLWRRAGFYRARLGLESGSERVLKLMDKKITIPNVKKAISNLANAGIKTTTYWVIGYPGETEEDFLQTLDLLTELADDLYEAHCNPFNYYVTGQVDSDNWNDKYNTYSLYPKKYRSQLMLETTVLDCEPSREVTYDRVWRFNEHCKKLKIADPCSLRDIYEADERWKRLHKTAVPSIVEFGQGNYIDESKKVEKMIFAMPIVEETDDWGF